QRQGLESVPLLPVGLVLGLDLGRIEFGTVDTLDQVKHFGLEIPAGGRLGRRRALLAGGLALVVAGQEGEARLLLLVDEAVHDVDPPRLDYGQAEGLGRTFHLLGRPDVDLELLELPLARRLLQALREPSLILPVFQRIVKSKVVIVSASYR